MRVGRACLMILLVARAPGGWAEAQSLAPAAPGDDLIATEPLRCWWRTGSSGVRVGESFPLVLTCAFVETERAKVVPDQSRFDPTAIQLPPFEVIEGARGPDQQSGMYRFIQYQYTLRLLTDEQFGTDVELPEFAVKYHILTLTDSGATTEGREQDYEMAPYSVRLLSLVPAEAADIREASAATFAALDEGLFQAGLFRIVGMVCFGLAAIAFIATLVKAAAQYRTRTPIAARALPAWVVGVDVGWELRAIRRERGANGWSADLAGRALGALRIVGALAIGLPVSQQRADGSSAPGAGAIVVRGWGWRRRRSHVSAALTPRNVEVEHQRLAVQLVPGHRRLRLLEDLQTALARFTAARYGRSEDFDEGPFDESLALAEGLQRRLLWQLLLPRRISAGETDAQPGALWTR